MFAVVLLVGAILTYQFVRRLFVTKEDLEDVDSLHEKLNKEVNQLKKEKKYQLIKPTVDDFNSQIFQLSNKDRDKYTIDLHGLYSDHAILELKNRINQLIKEKYKGKLLVITGRGSHSVGEAKIKPRVNSFLKENSLLFEENSKGGAFIVYLSSQNVLLL
ncbi:small MutS related family protein [Dictyostelium discoideum AX4]|uniref:Small MutS related family protein n=1 Tax=Dictyostelium discoideum TaxID=44689 RepID=Q54MD6_DICDI|nr:small MutS related family protein [Dictyostelium discoideum AX4]EAL64430.1 small MutS related family protein [Dictyostelium discoideum AX4]|eukprot:XP_637898.1 small MutS related family protein [Dictyostelium discoideum AX4]